MSATTAVLFLVGLALLLGGAELLVRGASRLAVAAGISPLVVGLTVVAFGTSSPELAVSLRAGLAGEADITMGNVIGSNVFNVLFILGASAAITPLVVSQQLVRLDVPLMIAASFAVFAMAWNGRISPSEGAFLFVSLVAYTVFLVVQSRRENADVQAEYAQAFGGMLPKRLGWIADVSMILLGLGLLVLGARWLVDGAVAIATALGVSKAVIGLTVIAAGTSLPEVATSILASLRGERDIAVGNVVGSNLYNLLAILGLTAVSAPDGLLVSDSLLTFDLPVMTAVAVACLPVFFTGYTIARWEGILFLAYYAAYTAYLVFSATGNPAREALQTAMLEFVIPITIVTLILVSVRAWRGKSATGE